MWTRALGRVERWENLYSELPGGAVGLTKKSFQVPSEQA